MSKAIYEEKHIAPLIVDPSPVANDRVSTHPKTKAYKEYR
jgi:hypothetical protein